MQMCSVNYYTETKFIILESYTYTENVDFQTFPKIATTGRGSFLVRRRLEAVRYALRLAESVWGQTFRIDRRIDSTLTRTRHDGSTRAQRRDLISGQCDGDITSDRCVRGVTTDNVVSLNVLIPARQTHRQRCYDRLASVKCPYS